MKLTDEMRAAALTCVICERRLPSVFPPDMDAEWLPQPLGGTWFIAHGQYGSGVYDESHGNYLLITICDAHLLSFARRGLVLERKPKQPVAEPATEVWHPPYRWDGDARRAVYDDPDQQVST